MSTTRSRTTPTPPIERPSKARRSSPANDTPPRPSRDEHDVETNPHAVRVLCVDDHAVLIEGLKAQFAIKGGIEVVGRLDSAARLADEVDRSHPHVVILDIEMPGPDAFEMADRLTRSHPDVRVVVLSAHIRDAFISASFSAGVSAYFAKSDDLDDIVRGIHDVVASRGKTFILGPKVRERCAPPIVKRGASGRAGTPGKGAHESFEDSPTTRLDCLTARESEILRLIGKGLSRIQIAAQLSRSVKTIDGHQSRMMKKVGIATRADLMRFAIREGLAQA